MYNTESCNFNRSVKKTRNMENYLLTVSDFCYLIESECMNRVTAWKLAFSTLHKLWLNGQVSIKSHYKTLCSQIFSQSRVLSQSLEVKNKLFAGYTSQIIPDLVIIINYVNLLEV